MFKQLDLFAGIPDEHSKRDEATGKTAITASGQAEALTAGQEDAVIAEIEASFSIETINDPEVNLLEVDDESPGTDIAAIALIKEKTDDTGGQKQPKAVAAKPVKGKRGRKSLKAMEEESDFISIPEDEILFKKQYYSIGEVARMFRLNSSLLRYWETEFDIIKPRKNRKGDRHFRPEDIKNLYLIHHLLRQRKYTIEGAKDYLKKNKSKAQQNFEIIQRLQKLKGFLLELKAGL